MTKFIIDITLDGYDTDEEMFNALTGDEVREVLQDYGFSVIKVEEVEVYGYTFAHLVQFMKCIKHDIIIRVTNIKYTERCLLYYIVWVLWTSLIMTADML